VSAAPHPSLLGNMCPPGRVGELVVILGPDAPPDLFGRKGRVVRFRDGHPVIKVDGRRRRFVDRHGCAVINTAVGR